VASGHWEDKFVGLAKTFQDQKGQIEFRLSLHVTVTLDAAAGTISEVNAKVDLLITLFQQKTSEEKRLAEVIAGRDLLTDSSALEAAVNFTKSLTPQDKGRAVEGKDRAGGSVTANVTLVHSLRASVDDLIDENKALFELKFESLHSAIERAEQRIIAELRSGTYEKILHPVSVTFMYHLAREFIVFI
jgi:hypothetical protein